MLNSEGFQPIDGEEERALGEREFVDVGAHFSWVFEEPKDLCPELLQLRLEILFN
jgi:hypothetical protein